MDFGGIVEQPLYSHHYRTESLRPPAFEEPLTKLDGVYDRKLSPFSALGRQAHWNGHGIVGGAPQLLSRYPPLFQAHNEDDVEDEEVMMATLGVDRRRSPPPHSQMACLPVPAPHKKATKKQQQQRPNPAVPSSHASGVPLPTWQALPPPTSPAALPLVPFGCEGGVGLDGRRLWTPEEDAALRDAVALHKGRNWKLIALSVPARTSVQCLQRWKHVLHPEVGKGSWTAKEDEELVRLVSIYGMKWSEISRQMDGRRIGKRCRERWENHLKAGLRKDRWSEAEEKVLIEARERLGNRWTDIAKMLDGRSVNQCKNHWYSVARRHAAQGQGATPSSSDASGASPAKATPTLTTLTKASGSGSGKGSSCKKATAHPHHSSSTAISLDPPAASFAAPPAVHHALDASSALLALAAGAEMVSSSSSSLPLPPITTLTITDTAAPPRRKRQLSSASPDPYANPLAPRGRQPVALPSSHPTLGPSEWSAAEDDALLAGVAEHGRRWSSLCQTTLLSSRSPASARARYFCLTLGHAHGPMLEPWADADFKLLREAYRRYPACWLIISRFLGRTGSDVEDAWFSLTPEA